MNIHKVFKERYGYPVVSVYENLLRVYGYENK